MTKPAGDPGGRPGGRPATLLVAAALTMLEGLVLVVYAVLELANINADRVSLAITTAGFFAIIGGGLAWCAWGLWRVQSWARSPVVAGQLITLLTGWSFTGGETTTVAVVLVVVALTVLVCLLHPRSTAALAAHDV